MSLPNLKELCCVSSFTSIVHIIKTISIYNSNIEVLDINGPFHDQISLQLAQLLSESIIQLVQSVSKLKSLKLRMKGIVNETLKAIGSYCNELQELDVNLSNCDEDSVIFLVKECKSLNQLNISTFHNNSMIANKLR